MVIGIIVYLLMIITLRAIKKEDIDLFREYLPGGLKKIVALIERFIPNTKAKGEPVEKT
jgi:hypothetical protein